MSKPTEGQTSNDGEQSKNLGPMPPEFRVVRCKGTAMVFGHAPLFRYAELVKRLNASDSQCVYLLEGGHGDQKTAREGRTGDPIARLACHHNNLEYRHFDRVAILAGQNLTENDVKGLECLVARQIAAVGRARHHSRGAEMPEVSGEAWSNARDAFLFFRRAAQLAGIDYLEPLSRCHAAAYWSSASGIQERWLPGAVEMRKSQIVRKRSDCGPVLDLKWGDFIAVAENRDGIMWLLAGSEIRTNAVASAGKRHSAARASLFAAGQAVAVRGYPDRLELLVDYEVGFSMDAVTKFVVGSKASDGERWREFQPRFSSGSSHSPEMN
jgi:hypothetical protein